MIKATITKQGYLVKITKTKIVKTSLEVVELINNNNLKVKNIKKHAGKVISIIAE